MELLGGAALAVAIFGFAVSLVGVLVVIWRVRDDTRRPDGLRITYAGSALACLGMSVFVLSRPADLLPPPLNLVLAGLVLVPFVRLARRAAFLRPPS